MNSLKVFCICALSLLGSCASPVKDTRYFSAPSVSRIEASADRVKSHITDATSHASKAKTAIKDAKKISPLEIPNLQLILSTAEGEIDLLTKSLLDAQSEVGVLKTELAKTKGEVNQITDELNRTITEKNKAMFALADVKKRYHRLKFGACTIGAALALMLIWKFKFILAFPGGFLGLIVGPGIVFGILWKIF